MPEDDFVPYLASLLSADGRADYKAVEQVVRKVFETNHTRPPTVQYLQELEAEIQAVLPDGKDCVDLVYGGVTKVKGYVFEAQKLPEIRGASALLDWINEVRLPQLWGMPDDSSWDEEDWPKYGIIYASGGNILAFTEAGKGQERAREIECLYTSHTLTANSVAVAATFGLLELRYGRLYRRTANGDLLPRKADDPFYWFEQFLRDWQDTKKQQLLQAYYYFDTENPPDYTPLPEGIALQDLQRKQLGADAMTEQELKQCGWRFFNRKTFGELVTVLATMFNRRRDERTAPTAQPADPTAAYTGTRFLPVYPALPPAEKCDSSGIRPAVWLGRVADEERMLSESSARKRYVGQVVKGKKKDTDWFTNNFKWSEADAPPDLEGRSWEREWRLYLEGSDATDTHYYKKWLEIAQRVEPAQDMHHIGAAAKGYIGFIYADGNNIGRLIATLATPQEYFKTSIILRKAAREAVFAALAEHLEPVKVHSEKGDERYVHPFEILTIGGDDLSLIVPANRASDIALTIGYTFEAYLAKALKDLKPSQRYVDRYHGKKGWLVPDFDQLDPKVGLSAGVVIAQENAPIFFLHDLVEELLKSAKKQAKAHVKDHHYYGGAIDFMVMKSITMVTDNIETFREQAFGVTDKDEKRQPDTQTKHNAQECYHLTSRPYSWHEFAGLVATLRELKRAGVPRSQLYRLRGVVQEAHSTGMGITRSVLEYLHTRVRLRDPKLQEVLIEHVEHCWCTPNGKDQNQTVRLPPWRKKQHRVWETVWADLVELYEMIEEGTQADSEKDIAGSTNGGTDD